MIFSRWSVRKRDVDPFEKPDDAVTIDDLVTASVRGSKLYDVTVELGGQSIDTRCTCPYDGGDCKHVVAVLLDVAANPPQDESGDIETVLEDVSATDLRASVRDAPAEHPELREQVPARCKSCFSTNWRRPGSDRLRANVYP